jgi:hypothetical protein
MGSDLNDTGTRAGLKQAPWWLRLALDVVMLKSTPLTAVVWGTFFIVVVIHIAYACGWLTRFGIDGGYATEEDLKGITTEINQNLERTRGDLTWLLKTQIYIASSALCATNTDLGRRADLANYIYQLESEYTAITKESVPTVPCPPPPASAHP